METTLIPVDLRGPSAEADCLDCLVALPVAVDRMRAAPNDPEISNSMIEHTRDAFRALGSEPRQNLFVMASAAQDRLYRHIAELTMMDRYTRYYFKNVVGHFFMQLCERNVRTFYVLDNAIRDDRLAGLLELFGLAGISTTTPRRDGKEWAPLATRMRNQVETAGHVAYIEPDGEVNYIEAAKALARDVGCVATFRNLAPDNPQIELLSLPKAEHEDPESTKKPFSRVSKK
jgi:hypothetical protein